MQQHAAHRGAITRCCMPESYPAQFYGRHAESTLKLQVQTDH